MIGTFASYGNQAASANRYNVVFVIDASGSMKNTDGSLWRYEAIDLFLGLATETGNRMGAVIFNDGIVETIGLQEINGRNMKTALSQDLRNSVIGGDTDIGSAIQEAVNILDAGRNPDIPSVIILLSDGNTDFPYDSTGTLLQQSNLNKQDAISRARQNGYSVFSVCLNANKKANAEELADISNATAGQFVEINQAEDLKEVFAQFYNVIYSTETINIADQSIPDSGILDIPFSVPSAGVEELNILINTLNPNIQYSVFQPTGIAYTNDELSNITIKVETFSVIKIPNPSGGTWKIQARGIPGDAVKIDIVYNSNFSVKAEVEPAGSNYAMNENVTFTAKVLSNNQELTDSGPYSVYPATLTITRVSDGSQMVSTLMQAEQRGYKADITLIESGEFYATVTVKFEGLEKTSERISMIVGDTISHESISTDNSTPEKAIKWFVKKDYGKTYDCKNLQEFVTDTEDSEWTIMIDSLGDYQTNQVYIEDGMLKVETKDLEKGTITLNIQDSQGTSRIITVELIPAANILYTILMIAGCLLGLVILVLILKKFKKYPFQGDVMINAFDLSTSLAETPRMIQPIQGKEVLGRYIAEGAGIDLNKTYLLADKSPKYIWLISGNGFYSSKSPEKKEKKIQLEDGIEIIVSKNSNLDCGLQIVYTNGNRMY